MHNHQLGSQGAFQESSLSSMSVSKISNRSCESQSSFGAQSQLLQKIMNKNEQNEQKQLNNSRNSSIQFNDYNFQFLIEFGQETMSNTLSSEQGQDKQKAFDILNQMNNNLIKLVDKQDKMAANQYQMLQKQHRMERKLQSITRILLGKKELEKLNKNFFSFKQLFQKRRNINLFFKIKQETSMIKILKQIYSLTKSYKNCLLVVEATLQILNYCAINRIAIKLEVLQNLIIDEACKNYLGRTYSTRFQEQMLEPRFNKAYAIDTIKEIAKVPPFLSKIEQLLEFCPAMKERFENYKLGGSHLYRICISSLLYAQEQLRQNQQEHFILAILMAWNQVGSTKNIPTQQHEQLQELSKELTAGQRRNVEFAKNKIIKIYTHFIGRIQKETFGTMMINQQKIIQQIERSKELYSRIGPQIMSQFEKKTK